MADIYLKHSKDSLKYIECYKELAEEIPTQENFIKLAEAYFSIRVSTLGLVKISLFPDFGLIFRKSFI